MTYLAFQQLPGGVAATAISLSAALTIPSGAQYAELQASGNHIRYTIDSANNPPTTTYGQLLRTTDPPKIFPIRDILNMKVIRDGAVTNSDLFIHYIS